MIKIKWMAEAKARLETGSLETRGLAVSVEQRKALGLFARAKQLAGILLFEAKQTRDWAQRQRLSIAAAVIFVPAVLACNGGEKENVYPTVVGSDTQEPVATKAVQTLTPQVTRPPEPAPEARRDSAVFNFGEDVPENLRQEIKNGFNLAIKWYSAKFGINIEGINVFGYGNADRLIDEYFKRTLVPGDLEQRRVRLRGATAFAGEQRDFFIITTSPGWVSAPPVAGMPIGIGRIHTISDELMSLFQREVGGYRLDPLGWLNEGGAFYMDARFLEENGLYSYEEIRRRHRDRAFQVRDSLQTLENQRLFTNYDYYLFSFMAMDLLTRGLPNNGVDAVVKYWKEIGSGRSINEAFSAAFGRSRGEFYTEFEAYRTRGFQ